MCEQFCAHDCFCQSRLCDPIHGQINFIKNNTIMAARTHACTFNSCTLICRATRKMHAQAHGPPLASQLLANSNLRPYCITFLLF
jgi:hypothetical protein